MKKFIALTLIAACLGCFSMGCQKPADKPADKKADAAAPAPAAPATDAAAPAK